jgi:hypothetical protein
MRLLLFLLSLLILCEVRAQDSLHVTMLDGDTVFVDTSVWIDVQILTDSIVNVAKMNLFYTPENLDFLGVSRATGLSYVDDENPDSLVIEGEVDPLVNRGYNFLALHFVAKDTGQASISLDKVHINEADSAIEARADFSWAIMLNENLPVDTTYQDYMHVNEVAALITDTLSHYTLTEDVDGLIQDALAETTPNDVVAAWARLLTPRDLICDATCDGTCSTLDLQLFTERFHEERTSTFLARIDDPDSCPTPLPE